jgi:hypothetical protein
MPQTTLPPSPVPEGRSRVVFDVTQGPARVERIAARSNFRGLSTTTLLCVTPCWGELPYGTHELHFVSESDPSISDDAILSAQEPLIGYTRTVGEHHNGGAFIAGAGFGLGVPAAVLGGLLYAREPDNGLYQAALGTGVVLVGVGLVAVLLAPETRQKGAATQWSIPQAQGLPTNP